jgi:hypothetical protein
LLWLAQPGMSYEEVWDHEALARGGASDPLPQIAPQSSPPAFPHPIAAPLLPWTGTAIILGKTAKQPMPADLHSCLVGLRGLEPRTSSLSGNDDLPLCKPAFLLVAADRK